MIPLINIKQYRGFLNLNSVETDAVVETWTDDILFSMHPSYSCPKTINCSHRKTSGEANRLCEVLGTGSFRYFKNNNCSWANTISSCSCGYDT